MEGDNLPESNLVTIQWSRHLNVGSEVKDNDLVELVVAEVDVEAVADLLQALAELTSTPSHVL
jgi:bifunctional pyridoxal-dependent enzyme with beta-cystathionase and maltose regulon repressor activities